MELESQSPCREPKSKKPGGWRAIKYILGNESFEKLASISLQSNLTVYLRSNYNLGGIFLVNVIQIWSGTTNISAIAGAIVSDVFIGRFYTLLIGTIFSLSGMVAMTLTAGVHKLRPETCHDQTNCTQPHTWQLGFLFSALGLVAIGAGGIRPCNIAFGADQFDTNTDKGKKQLESFFNWWYLSFTVVLMVALTGVVYVQTNISWIIGFAIPIACLATSVTLFLVGYHTYIHKKPQGTVFIDLIKVISSAFRKRNVNLKLGGRFSFYKDGVSVEMDYSTKNKFMFLDKAAVICDQSNELDAHGSPKSSWRLCSVQQVENLKCLFGIFPVWISSIGCFVAMDQQSTFGILQSLQMNRVVGRHFTIPPAWMGISSMVALAIWLLIYEQFYLPTAKKLSKRDCRIKMEHRITIGIGISIICMVIAGLVERKRHELSVREKVFVSPLHVGYLLPQFMLSGLAEAFAAVAIMEFFTIQLPESMRSVAGAIFFLSLSFGSYVSSIIVNIVHKVTASGGKTPWLGDHDLNNTKLEYYYYIIAILGCLNLIYFTFFGSKYVLCGKGVTVVTELELGNSGQQREGNVLVFEVNDAEKRSV